jgi:type I site-specific restriction-modification system R (restriction) subunit
MKDEDDKLKLVIVRDMWLIGFDVPGLHTMYVDKPMRDHNLMQAIARANRVFRNKPEQSKNIKKFIDSRNNPGVNQYCKRY